MRHTEKQNITQLQTYLALLQVKETLETYREFFYQIYLFSLCTYDSHSRLSTLTYPNGYSITNHYKNAILDSIIGGDGKRHYDVREMNAYGDIKK